MNLILIKKSASPGDTIDLYDYQFSHLTNILRVKLSDLLRVGILNGNIGSAQVVGIYSHHVSLTILSLDESPPPTLPVTVILSLPRPQMIKRILQTVATMGVEKLCLIQSNRVEKSYWQSPSVTDSEIYRHMILGLEQGIATQLPTVEKYRNFSSFAEHNLDNITINSSCLIAHPGHKQSTQKTKKNQRYTVAIGPEGGFTEVEVNAFIAHGFTPINLGTRVLKVETAIPVILAKLFI